MDSRAYLKSFTIMALILMLSMTLCPAVLASRSSSRTSYTYTYNGVTVTFTKRAEEGGFVYVGEAINTLESNGMIGEYSFTITQDGSSYKAWVTLPNGEIIDPRVWQFADDWHGPWWARYELKGWMIAFTGADRVDLAILLVLLSCTGWGATFAPIAAAVLTACGIYVDSDGIMNSYWDIILLYGCIYIYQEAGFWTNCLYGVNLGQRYFMPVYPVGACWHTGVWPSGW